MFAHGLSYRCNRRGRFGVGQLDRSRLMPFGTEPSDLRRQATVAMLAKTVRPHQRHDRSPLSVRLARRDSAQLGRLPTRRAANGDCTEAIGWARALLKCRRGTSAARGPPAAGRPWVDTRSMIRRGALATVLVMPFSAVACGGSGSAPSARPATAPGTSSGDLSKVSDGDRKAAAR
jgi:hypothetical protein